MINSEIMIIVDKKNRRTLCSFIILSISCLVVISALVITLVIVTLLVGLIVVPTLTLHKNMYIWSTKRRFSRVQIFDRKSIGNRNYMYYYRNYTYYYRNYMYYGLYVVGFLHHNLLPQDHYHCIHRFSCDLIFSHSL